MLCSLSKLTEKDLQEINKLEKELHTPLLAYTCNKAEIAELSSEKLKKIQELENKLGISLVAVSGSC